MVSEDNLKLFVEGLKSDNSTVFLASVIGITNNRDTDHIPLIMEAMEHASSLDVSPDEFNLINSKLIDSINLLSRV